MSKLSIVWAVCLLFTLTTTVLAGPPEADFQPLFDGETLDGWDTMPGGRWAVRDGVIVGTSKKSERRHGMLITERQYDDFVARIVYKAVQGNSGLYFRVEKVDSPVNVHGFQADIDPKKDAGGLYETGGRAWVVKPAKKDVKKYFHPGEWNTMIVKAAGRDVTVWVNGTKAAELKDDPGRTEGFIAVQLHGGMDMHIEIKSIEIAEL